MKTKVMRLKLDPNKRILITSDIHGGVDILKRLLEKVNFSQNDYLFILGDLIERGPKSLETVRYVIKLVSCGNTFVLKGNNDSLADEIKNGTLDIPLFNFITDRGSLYTELCNELGIKVNNADDLKKANQEVYNGFKKEIDFLYELPHIIETERFLFAHAGIDNYECLEENDPERVMRQDTFANYSSVAPKLTFVGHYPSVVYSNKIPNYSPKRNFQNRVISIDGGYAVKDEGQINMVIVDSENNINIDYIYDDSLLECKVKTKQIGNNDYDLIIWGREKFEVLEEYDDECLCLLENKKTISIPKMFLYKQRDKWYCMDYTNRILSLEEGERVKFVKSYKDLSLVKYGPVAGWVKTENLEFKKADD